MGPCLSQLKAYRRHTDVDIDASVHVFWDHENIATAADNTPERIMAAVKRTFPRLHLHPLPVINVYRVHHSEQVSKKLSQQGCRLLYCPKFTSGQKEVVDNHIMNDMWRLVVEKRHVVVVLISNDSDFMHTMRSIGMLPHVTTLQCCTKRA